MKKTDLKIALICTTKNLDGPHETPLGLISIASYLCQKKIIKKKNIIILDAGLQNVLDFIKVFKPDIVGIASMSFAMPEMTKLASNIKQMFDVPIVLGGIHISLCHDYLPASFDIGVIGEGEETFYELVKLYTKQRRFRNLENVKGIVYRGKDSQTMFTGYRNMLTPDKMPSLDWSLIPTDIYFGYENLRVNGTWKPLKRAFIFTARGCPFNCVFCCRQGVFKGVRYFSIKKVVDEIENLVTKYKIQVICLRDDTFTINKKRIEELINELKKRNLLGKVVFYQLFARSDLIDEEFLTLLKQLNVISLCYGFESGSNKVLGYLKNNTITVEQNKKTIELSHKYDMGVIGNFMIGSPNETKQDMLKTLRFIDTHLKMDRFIEISIFPTIPYPNTELWNHALKTKVVSESMKWEDAETLDNFKKSLPFFREKISLKDYRLIWDKVQKLKFKLYMKHLGRHDFLSGERRVTKQRSRTEALLPYLFIKHDLLNGRYFETIYRVKIRLGYDFFNFSNIKKIIFKLRIIIA